MFIVILPKLCSTQPWHSAVDKEMGAWTPKWEMMEAYCPAGRILPYATLSSLFLLIPVLTFWFLLHKRSTWGSHVEQRKGHSTCVVDHTSVSIAGTSHDGRSWWHPLSCTQGSRHPCIVLSPVLLSFIRGRIKFHRLSENHLIRSSLWRC